MMEKLKEFTDFGPIIPDTLATGTLETYTAHERFLNPRGLPLLENGTGPFCRFRVPNAPKSPGVYAFWIDEVLQYIGKTTMTLAKRWGRGGYGGISPRNCFRGGQATNVRINWNITRALNSQRTIRLACLCIEDRAKIATLETDLVRHFRPPLNRQLFGGAQ